jgi:hypothetical protein
MATDFDDHYHDDTTIIHIRNIEVALRLVHCCPGDFARVKPELEDCDISLVRRMGSCIVACGFTVLSTTGDRPGRDDPLSLLRRDEDPPAAS